MVVVVVVLLLLLWRFLGIAVGILPSNVVFFLCKNKIVSKRIYLLNNSLCDLFPFQISFVFSY